ncbi:MAG: hypothetical protein RL768_2602 [Nitrospirota bacterium]
MRKCIRLDLISAAALSLAACAFVVACNGSDPAPPPPASKAKVFVTGQAANVVIGQPDFTSNTAGTTAAIIDEVYGSPVVAGGKLYVPDYNNRRVLGFNAVPTTNGASADFVLGQADFTSSGFSATATGMRGPQTAVTSGGKLLVLDYSYNRVLIWNSLPTSTQVPADVVVGQPDLTTVSQGCSATKLDSPESLAIVQGALVVADAANHRVLVWNTIPTTNGVAADAVFGQPDFTTCSANTGGLSGTSLNYPTDIASNGTKLAVADSGNNRVLIYNSIPVCTGACTVAPDVVMGQPDFTSDAADNGGLSATSLENPYFLASDGARLAVADSDNNRVLIWNSFPTCTPVAPATNCASTTPADIVLGQPDFVSDTVDNDGTTFTTNAQGLSYPAGVYFNGVNQLFVADKANKRFLIFNAQ